MKKRAFPGPPASAIRDERRWSSYPLAQKDREITALRRRVEETDRQKFSSDVAATPAGRALFQMLGVFAEFERAIIQERVRAGIARARAAGKHLGRPRINGETEQAIQAALAAGKGIRKVARECGVGVSVVQRIRAG